MTAQKMTTDKIASAGDLSFYLGDTLGMCGCGEPEETIALLQKTLRILNDRSNAGYDLDKRKTYYVALEKLLGKEQTPGLYWWFLYFLGHMELTEHGGTCCGSWLSESGEQLLAALDKWGQEVFREKP